MPDRPEGGLDSCRKLFGEGPGLILSVICRPRVTHCTGNWQARSHGTADNLIRITGRWSQTLGSGAVTQRLRRDLARAPSLARSFNMRSSNITALAAACYWRLNTNKDGEHHVSRTTCPFQRPSRVLHSSAGWPSWHHRQQRDVLPLLRCVVQYLCFMIGLFIFFLTPSLSDVCTCNDASLGYQPLHGTLSTRSPVEDDSLFALRLVNRRRCCLSERVSM